MIASSATNEAVGLRSLNAQEPIDDEWELSVILDVKPKINAREWISTGRVCPL